MSIDKNGISLFKVVFEEGMRDEQTRGNIDVRAVLVRRIRIETVYQVGKPKKLLVEDEEGKKTEVSAIISDIRYEPVGDRWGIVVYLEHDEYEAPVIIRMDVHNCRMFRDADTIWGFTLLEEKDNG